MGADLDATTDARVPGCCQENTMKRALLIALATLLLPLGLGGKELEWRSEGAWFADEAWDDGAAVVSVFHGKYRKYGVWRDAEARDYAIREYFDARELTKRERETDLRVLKANRLVRFQTGTYEYRLMASLFFDRADGQLVKATGSSQEGCGIAFRRWDRNARSLSHDTYWEGEGAGSRDFPKEGHTFFVDELPFVAPRLPAGTPVTVFPSLTNSNWRGFRGRGFQVQRSGSTTELVAADGSTWATFTVDGEGHLLAWTIANEQEFSRTARKRMYYWEHTAPGDEELLQ